MVAINLIEECPMASEAVLLEARFTQAMLDLYEQTSSEIKYKPKVLYEWTQSFGGVEAARKLLKIGNNAGVSSGFQKLWEAKRLDLSSEALMLKPEYASLFTQEELAQARHRLKEYGYTAP
jgi:hypothetical protein